MEPVSRQRTKLDIVRTLQSIIRDPDCPEHMRKLNVALQREEWDTMRALDLQNWTNAAKALHYMAATEAMLTIASFALSGRAGRPAVTVAIVASWVVLACIAVWTIRAGRQYRRRWIGVAPGDPPLDSIERAARER